MNLEQLITFLAIGGLAGWLAGLFFKRGGFGLLGNIIVGVLGAVFGGWLFGQLGIRIGGQWLGPIITATVGAVVLLYIIQLIKKA